MSKDAINATLAMCGYHEMRDGRARRRLPPDWERYPRRVKMVTLTQTPTCDACGEKLTHYPGTGWTCANPRCFDI